MNNLRERVISILISGINAAIIGLLIIRTVVQMS